MDFEWDERKRRENLRKHGLDFRDAPILFTGPMLIRLDNRYDYEEPRWIGIGFLESICAVAVFTERNQGTTVRIISLRKALAHERKAFEKTIKDRLA
ncbi:MAG: BrnT family toxin [Gammaproteobacteria bacterium]|nr:MAG: BrnT family toxin [Gammaproteobacteria bacterium]